jgi:hypothetical protein
MTVGAGLRTAILRTAPTIAVCTPAPTTKLPSLSLGNSIESTYDTANQTPPPPSRATPMHQHQRPPVCPLFAGHTAAQLSHTLAPF